MKKEYIRLKNKQILEQINNTIKRQKDIEKQLKNIEHTIKNIQHIACYSASKEEINIFTYLIKNYTKKNFYLPKFNEISKDYNFCSFQGENYLTKGQFNISEPQDSKEKNNLIELAFIPGLSFDSISFHRLGRGQGFYDRLLKKTPQAIKIGICFSEQLFSPLPIDKWDIKMDYIITDKEIFKKIK